LKETSKSFLLLGWIVAILFIVKCSGGGGIPDPCQFIPKDSPLCKSLNCPACINPPVPTTTTTTTTLPPDPIPPTPFPTPKPTPSPIPPTECSKLTQPSACPEIHTSILEVKLIRHYQKFLDALKDLIVSLLITKKQSVI